MQHAALLRSWMTMLTGMGKQSGYYRSVVGRIAQGWDPTSYRLRSAGGAIETDTDRIWSVMHRFVCFNIYTGDSQIKNRYMTLGRIDIQYRPIVPMW
jgi:hypothetical protein